MKKKAFLIIGLLLVALLLYSRTSSAAARSPLSKLTPTVKQLTWLSNETVRQVSQKEPTGSGQLTIQNGTVYDAQVKVIDISTQPNKAVYNVYVPSHQDYTITGIDDGTYVLAFWLGDANNGHGQKFKDTFNYKTIQTSQGVETTTYTVMLQDVGNALTEGINRGEFDNY